MPNWEKITRDAARAAGIDEEIFARQIGAESGFNPRAKSPAGATGIAQIMPATAKGWGVDPNDPRASLTAAAGAMSKYLDSYGNWRDALTAYNAGPGRVGKPLYAETRGYIDKILGGKNPKDAAPSARTYANSGPASSGGMTAYDFVMQGSPFAGLKSEPNEPVAQPQASSYTGSAPRGKPTADDWRELQRVATKKFGLQNDPGDSQTTGGKHSAGSEHYSERAIDFGDARNSWKQLNAWAAWARNHGYDVLNEGDHIHVSLPGSGV